MKWKICLLLGLLCKVTALGPLVEGECCPPRCSCNRREVFCNGASLTALPRELGTCVPMSIQRLRLDDNRLSVIGGSPFVRFKNLTDLYLHENVIHSISNSAFMELENLKVL
jgi:hypothetical protein